jgi:predicted ribosomally synthesized peptide with nif11-like leader
VDAPGREAGIRTPAAKQMKLMNKSMEDLMSREGVETLMDRWTNDPAFRTQLRADPEGAARAAGVDLDTEEWAALRGIDWSLSDEELQARSSKVRM